MSRFIICLAGEVDLYLKYRESFRHVIAADLWRKYRPGRSPWCRNSGFIRRSGYGPACRPEKRRKDQYRKAMTQLTFESLLKQDYLSVTELTGQIKSILEDAFPQTWVQGEISNLVHHSSGHMYFSLKDERAQISCVMWRSRNEWLYFIPEDGMKVVVNARISIYEKRGNYQLDVWQMIPSGAGELQLAFEQLKARLKAEGLFDPQHKKPIPRFPEKIGIVTSPTGAAIQDLLSVLHRRFPSVEIILNPVRVQGEGAAAEISAAIDEFNKSSDVDVLIVGRGGGSLEDLWAFNEEIVARAVYRSEIPIISAVGHEIDYTICDFVADLRAPTPSAAAELAVVSRDKLREALTELQTSLTLGMLDNIKYFKDQVQSFKSSYAMRQPLDLVYQQSQTLDEMRRRLEKNIAHDIALKGESLKGLSQRLSLLEHENVLKRGYSLCYRTEDGKLVRSADALQKEDEIKIQFYKGKALGVIQDVEN